MADLLEAAVMATFFQIQPHRLTPTRTPSSIFLSPKNPTTTTTTTTIRRTRTWNFSSILADSSPSPSPSSSSWTQNQTVGELLLVTHKNDDNCRTNMDKKKTRRKRVFLLDVNPICYKGNIPSLHSFAHWITLFFSQVSLGDSVIAVFDGERGNQYRRQLMPSYKAHRQKFSGQNYSAASLKFSKSSSGRSYKIIADLFRKLNVPVIKIDGHEADDVVATLVSKILQKGYRVVIASPDKDFKQLISEDVQIVMPMPELDRWSFYTLKHYIAQYNCDPCSDLSLRCIMGDEVDGVPGIQHMVPGFGRKTALKLLKKHGSLENLLDAAAVRTVGRQYAQDALTKYADFLRRNYKVLALRRDVDVHLQDEWLSERDTAKDLVILSDFLKLLGESQKPDHGRNRYHSTNA